MDVMAAFLHRLVISDGTSDRNLAEVPYTSALAVVHHSLVQRQKISTFRRTAAQGYVATRMVDSVLHVVVIRYCMLPRANRRL
jgi:hypothetical protein